MACPLCQQPHAPQKECPTVVRGSPERASPAPASAAAPDLVGRQLGSFRLVKRLGVGGMGTVYLAEHAMIGSRVAVKVLHPHLALQPSLVQRFYAEARAVNLIGHENILKIYDLSSSEDGLHYLIMEYLAGRDLAQLISGPLDPRLAISILIQTCDALAAVHAHGVVHRDLKPENVFLVERPGRPATVKLLDFGIAKLLQDPGGVHTTVGMIVGTPEYMAPEQFMSSTVDGRADLYALGVISYQLATGHLPFTGAGLAGLMLSHRESIPTAPRELCPQVPAGWSRITMRALAKKPEARYQSAQELRDDLARVLEGLDTGRHPAPAPPARPAAHVAIFAAEVHGPGGQRLCTAQCTDLSRNGVFLAADAFTPPLFSSLRVSLRAPGGTLELDCEVVRHVTAGQAAAWGMAAGVGVQFVRLTAEQKALLDRLVRGEPLPAPTPPEHRPDPAAAALLETLRRRAASAGPDHYALLGLAPDAEGAEIRARGRELRRQLEECRPKLLSGAQRSALEAVAERVTQALHVLSSTERRAEYDAGRGNFRGVARAIAAGLRVSDLEQLRRRFLADHPRAESRAQVQATCGRVYEGQAELSKAIDAYEQALKDDPLDLTLHQRYWPLHRRLSPPPAPPAGA